MSRLQTKKDFSRVVLIRGWDFKPKDYEKAWFNKKLLNTSIETSNICNLSCEYCFRQETGQTTKKRLLGEISLEQTYKIIDEVTELGAKSIYIVGAGEPLLDANLKDILKYIHQKNIIPIISTNGSQIDEKWIKIFQKYDVSIVIKLNSFDSKLQDELANRKGYAKKRDKGLSLLLKTGFNKPAKDGIYQTRLAINSIVCQKNKHEILDIFKYCRENNIMPIMSTFVPAGKTKNRTDLEVSLEEFLEISRRIRDLDKDRYKIVYSRLLPYLGGIPCSQNGKASIYITILGDIYECPGQQHNYGNIKSMSVKKAFEKLRKQETNFNFGCPPRISYWKDTNQLNDSNQNKKAWKSTIPADDLNKHMLATKQVQANAKILQQMISDFPIKPKMKILIPGCGTGQIFDFLHLSLPLDCYITFTDINKEYLEKINQRFKKFQKISYEILEDDVEATKIQEKFTSCVLILVLEHVNWQKTLQNILNFGIKSFYLIIQKQDKKKQTVTSYENVPKSITKFSRIAKTHIIDESELKRYFKKEGFNLLKRYSEKVINNKEMVGMYFSKK